MLRVSSAAKHPQPAHQHMDFVLRARLTDPNQAIVQEHPDAVVKWFTKDEVEALPDNEMYGKVRSYLISMS